MLLISSLYVAVTSVFVTICSGQASASPHAHAHAHAHARTHTHSRSSTPSYNPTSKSNVALYWGQGAGQQRLSYFCSQTTVDIIPIAFIDIFPAQGNGFPGDNFGNQCWGGTYVYPGPGSNPSLNQLQSECPQINADIPMCQSRYGKRIILSLGGASASYQLTGTAQGVAFANFLWGAFGPQTASWLASGLPRPFDGPNNLAVEVDGFDFDIEYAPTDGSAGYIAMIQRLRTLFPGASKPYLITGAPQCVVPDANMGTMIAQAQFDIIWVQYYNTPQCSARNWVNANPNYGKTGVEIPSGFSYNTWATFLVGTASANAKLYIGVPGGPTSDTNYLNPSEISNLVKAFYCKPNFGGVMIWEATVADANPSGPYYSTVKNILLGYQSSLCPTTSTSKASSTVSTLKTSTLSPSRSSLTSSTLLRSTATSKYTSISSGQPSITIKQSNTLSSPAKSSSIKSSTISSAKQTSTLVSTTKSIPASPILSSKTILTSSSRTTVSSKSPSPTIVVPAGGCGSVYNVVCAAGYCCSQYGFCGTGAPWCGTGCQVGFGLCN